MRRTCPCRAAIGEHELREPRQTVVLYILAERGNHLAAVRGVDAVEPYVERVAGRDVLRRFAQ